GRGDARLLCRTAAKQGRRGDVALRRQRHARSKRKEEGMDRESRRRFEEFRRSTAGEAENTLIDELIDGEMDRSEFIRRGSVFGLSLTGLAAALAAAGEAPLAFAKPVAANAGGRLRGGCIPPPAPGLHR